MPYTWEQVAYGIDVKDENRREAEERQDIYDKQVKEQEQMALWGTALSIVGGFLFGPAGYFAGKTIGRTGADLLNTWEYDELTQGKFDNKEALEWEEGRDEAATDQTYAQIMDTITDAATMYIQAGGLEEGFEGWSDLSTFGTGDTAWTALGEDTWLGGLPGVSSSDNAMFMGGGPKLLQKGGMKQLSENIQFLTDPEFKRGADLSMSATPKTLQKLWEQFQQEDKA